MNAIGPRRALAAIAIALALAATLALGAAPTPAHAAKDILISSDGVTFGTTLTDGLFDDVGLLVPMDSVTGTFWVQNPTASAASLRVSLLSLIVSSAALASSLTLTSFDSGTGGTSSSSLSTLAVCDIIVPGQTVPAGGVVRVDLTLTMLNVSGSTAQGTLGSLSFQAAMRDSVASPFPPSACDDDGVPIPSTRPAGPIAWTGDDLPTDWFAAGGALVGFGILLFVRSRRRRDEPTVPE